MTTYAILTPGDVIVGYIQSETAPSFGEMGDKLALEMGFEDRDAMIDAHPGMVIGYAPLH